ncbi:MAG: PAC2 family protein, partial [Acidimicrobiia bacterium]
SIDSDEHIDYQSRRPFVEFVDGVATSVRWPRHEFYATHWKSRDVVVLKGIEPNVRWQSYCDAIIAVARDTGCSMVITLGALLGDVPHTRPVRVTGNATDPAVSERLGLAPSRYEGPTGIVGVLGDRCRREGLTSASLWAPVPHYVASPPNPPATRALLDRLSAIADLGLTLTPLDDLVDVWRAQVDGAIADNDELITYVRDLETRGDTDADDADDEAPPFDPRHPTSGPLPSADDLVGEVEQFLREQGPSDS